MDQASQGPISWQHGSITPHQRILQSCYQLLTLENQCLTILTPTEQEYGALVIGGLYEMAIAAHQQGAKIILLSVVGSEEEPRRLSVKSLFRLQRLEASQLPRLNHE